MCARAGCGSPPCRLADTWTHTCDAAEYVSFLRALHDRIAVQVDGQAYLWRADADIAFDPQFDDSAMPARTATPSPRRSLTPGRRSKLSTGRDRPSGRGFGASGLHWQRCADGDCAGSVEWLRERSELSHAGLAAALPTQTDYTAVEWAVFGVVGLRYTHFVVAVDGAYYTPAADRESATRAIDGGATPDGAASSTRPPPSPLLRSRSSLARVSLLSVRFLARLRALRQQRRRQHPHDQYACDGSPAVAEAEAAAGDKAAPAAARPHTASLTSLTTSTSFTASRATTASGGARRTARGGSAPRLVQTPEFMLTTQPEVAPTGSAHCGGGARLRAGANVVTLSFGGPSNLRVGGAQSWTAGAPVGAPPPMAIGEAEVWTLPDHTSASAGLQGPRPTPLLAHAAHSFTARLRPLSPRAFITSPTRLFSKRPATAAAAAPAYAAAAPAAAAAADWRSTVDRQQLARQAAAQPRPQSALPPLATGGATRAGSSSWARGLPAVNLRPFAERERAGHAPRKRWASS